MRPEEQALLVLFGMAASFTGGCMAGWILGRNKRMSKREAASILAKASWRNR